MRELYEDFNKQTYNRQTSSHQDLLCMSISEHSNGLDSTIEFKCNKKKQYKRLSNHHFPFNLPHQTIHRVCETRYAALIWYSINFQWVFGMQLIGNGGREIKKALGDVESTLAGILEKKIHKN